MKRHIENFLVWALGKLDIERLKRLTIDENRVSIGYSKFVPDDENWHEVSLTVIFWLKRGRKSGALTKYGEVSLYTDREKTAEWKLDNHADI